MALPEINIINATLVADPELRFTNSGKAVANFRTASNSRKKNPDTGQWENGDSTFLTVNVWGELGENAAQQFQKGSKITIKGVLKQRDYETREGEKRTVFEVEAYEVSAPVSRFKDDDGQPRQGSATQGNQFGGAPQGGFSGGQDAPPF